MLAYLEERLGLRSGEANEFFTLRETECLASCGTAPCLQVNEVHYESLTRQKVDELLAKLMREAGLPAGKPPSSRPA
jgi:NADH-quinone oxidoreductase subunit E